ncbi:ATP-binding protein [Cupriavidus sp. 2TAF22]|uniref:HAMP domain-containing sensor histidine kinase n=1 Tax=unclassified Cupriavidus TaxID=2640874 RepID=UPI003F919944
MSGRWHQRARHAVRHRLHLRLVLLFLLLALATTVTFVGGMQKAFSTGWRSAARPLVADYVDRLAAEIGSPPSVERARAISARLPVSVRIAGPRVNWQSEDAPASGWRSGAAMRWPRHGPDDDAPLFSRTTADGHRIDFGLSTATWQNQPHRAGWITLAVLLGLTALAYLYVRHLLRPLDDIRAGARRFGAGEFGQPIPIRRRDELGVLAHDVNTMARDIHQMLDAKRALLLAISHELRSPLTRARLNTELLPDTPEVRAQREALLRDLAGMRDLVTDLLESERLGQGHGALLLEPTDLAALAREVALEVTQAMRGDRPAAGQIALSIDAGLPATLALDRTRMRLLLRNLLDNALRHSAAAPRPPELHLARDAGGSIALRVRDHGPGVPDDQLSHLAEPFYRPDAARERATGGIGLGLYLCKLVAQAHGARWQVRNAQPGLEIEITLPPSP